MLGEELLVHPDYLQSSTSHSHKSTKWLLDVRYPFTSIAAGMVMLTRVRSTTREAVIESPMRDGLLVLRDERIAMYPRPVLLDGRNVTQALRAETTGNMASVVAARSKGSVTCTLAPKDSQMTLRSSTGASFPVAVRPVPG